MATKAADVARDDVSAFAEPSDGLVDYRLPLKVENLQPGNATKVAEWPRVQESLDGLLAGQKIDQGTYNLVSRKLEVAGFADATEVVAVARAAALQLNRLTSVEKAALTLSPKQLVIIADADFVNAKTMSPLRVQLWNDGRDGQLDGQSIQSQNERFIQTNAGSTNPEMQAKIQRARATNDALNTIYELNHGYNSGHLIVVKAQKVLSPELDNGTTHPTLLHEVGHALADLATEVSPEFAQKVDLGGTGHVEKHAHANPHLTKNNSEFMAASYAKFRYEFVGTPKAEQLLKDMQGPLVAYVQQNKPG